MKSDFDIGFLGGGQLARMSIQAAQRMGLKCLSLDPGLDTPASQIATSNQGQLSNPGMIAEVLRRCDHVTLENEFIRAEHIRIALELANVDESKLVPSVDALYTIQDKLRQRIRLAQRGVPTPKAVAIEGDGSFAISEIGFPMVLKARFGGYDGKGTRYAKTFEEFQQWRTLWEVGGWLAEEYVPFRRELAVMAFVGRQSSGCFPTMETVQTNHVCDLVFPCDVDASEIALAAVEAMGGNGLFGVELFEKENGEILVNEIAPRPHNTGHYTLDWGGPSQFEQHIRLAMGFPLAEPTGRDTCMANLLGQTGSGRHVAAIAASLEQAGVFFHWYGKTVAKEGRKMGHINAVGQDCVSSAVQARKNFDQAWTASSLD